jgi:hypothetical protein
VSRSNSPRVAQQHGDGQTRDPHRQSGRHGGQDEVVDAPFELLLGAALDPLEDLGRGQPRRLVGHRRRLPVVVEHHGRTSAVLAGASA